MRQQRLADALTIENFDDLLADEVLDVIIIDNSLFKNREKTEKQIQFIKVEKKNHY